MNGFQDYILLVHCVIFVLLYCIKDDNIYDEKTKKKLNIVTWIVGIPCFIFIAIMSVYLAQRNY